MSFSSAPVFFAVFIFGLFFGVACIPFLTHWLRLVLAALGRGVDTSKRHKRPRRSAGFLVLAVIHPAPWLILVGLPYLAHRILTSDPRPVWHWFFAGLSATVPLIGVLIFVFVRKGRRTAARSVTP